MNLCMHRKIKQLLHSLSLAGNARALYQCKVKVWSCCSEPKNQLLTPSCKCCIVPLGKRLLDCFDSRAVPRGGTHMKHQPLIWSWEHKPYVPSCCASHTWSWVPGLQVGWQFCSSPGAPKPLLRHRWCCPLPATGSSERWCCAEQLAILQFPLVTKLHMFRKLNLCQRLVVPSQKIQSDLYIALHKFLVNLYNHLERELLLISQRTAAMATSVTETAGLYKAVPGTLPRTGRGGRR